MSFWTMRTLSDDVTDHSEIEKTELIKRPSSRLKSGSVRKIAGGSDKKTF